MTSESIPARAYVWVWLPGTNQPVVAGMLEASSDIVSFNYGQSYLQRDGAVALVSCIASCSPSTPTSWRG
jgi:serine/threonine-protein kinase HipA